MPVYEKVTAKQETPIQPAKYTHDPINHPAHYTQHPSGIECIQITEHMRFNLGNAIKYIWRADLKGSSQQDLEKAIWYIQRELALRSKVQEASRS